MRIERIDLLSFGHFVDTTVDLDHPAGGLRFVVGPNEAGKSTLRAALRTGLFGFDGRHSVGRPSAASKLALHLTCGDGAALEVVRHGLGVARDGAGQPIAPNELERWVTMTREAFDRLCYLGHDELRRYGHELLQSGAELGRIAFGAALGGTHVQRVGADLAARLETLYTRGGRAKALNKAIDELRSADAALRSATITADAWLELRSHLEAEARHLGMLDEQEAGLAREQALLARVQRTANARAALREHREALQHLHELGPVPSVEVAERVERLQSGRRKAADAIAEHRSSIERLDARLESIPTDRSALDVTSEITALHQEIAGYREAFERVRQHELFAASNHPLPEADRLMAVLTDEVAVRAQMDTLQDEDAAIAGLRAGLAASRADLGLEHVPDDALAAQHVPTQSSIESALDAQATHSATAGTLAEELEALEGEIKRTERAILDVETGGAALPSDGEIAAARAHRDDAWSALKAWFVEDVRPTTLSQDRPELAQAVEVGIERADGLVDRLRADTNRAAQLQSERQRLDGLRSRYARATKRHEALMADAEAAAEAWRALWAGVTERVGSPAEMNGWRSAWRQACADATTLAAAVAKAAQRRRAIEASSERLRAALTASGHDVPQDAGARALLAYAETLVETERQRRHTDAQSAEASARIERVETRLAPLLPLVPQTERVPGDRAIQALHELREQQAAAGTLRDGLARQRSDALDALTEASSRLDRFDEDLLAEARGLGVDVEQLAAAVARAEAAKALKAKIDTRTEQLRDAGEGLSVDELHAEAEDAGDADAITARVEAIERERARIKAERTEATKRQADLEARLRAITGDDHTAALHEVQARALSAIDDLLDEIAVLSLATSMLDRVVDDARAAGRGPLIERAGHYFELLTDAAFSGLDLELHGELSYPVAVRADGSRLYPPALSDGTVDQLWLAWRLAGVEYHLDQIGPVPLIVDDVLVNFDDQRAGSAFQALASLAERTQVLVLTHHPHLVGIARERVGYDRVEVAVLEGRPEAALPVTQVVAVDEVLVPPPVPERAAPSGVPTRAERVTTATGDAPLEALRSAVDGDWRGKAELLERSGIASGAWNASIKALVSEGWAEQMGAKRGAKYRRRANEM